MKNLLIIPSLLLAVNIFADELKWVDEQIQAIKPPRIGISSSKVNAVSDPFIFLDKNKDKSKKSASTSRPRASFKKASTLSKSKKSKVSKKSSVFVLDAIINKSALINGKWYKIEDMVGKYTLSNVENTMITLKYKNEELLLSTDSRSKNLKFKNK